MAVQYDSKNNSWSTWLDTFKKDIPSASKEAVSAFEKIKKAQEAGYKIDNMDRWIHQNKLADKSLIKFLTDTEYSEKTLENYQLYLKKSSGSLTLFQRATKAAGSALKKLFATLGSMAVMFAITEGIQLVINGFSKLNDLIKENKHAIGNSISENYERASNTLDTFSNAISKTEDKISNLEELRSKLDGVKNNQEDFYALSDDIYDATGYWVNGIKDISSAYETVTKKIDDTISKSKEYENYLKSREHETLKNKLENSGVITEDDDGNKTVYDFGGVENNPNTITDFKIQFGDDSVENIKDVVDKYLKIKQEENKDTIFSSQDIIDAYAKILSGSVDVSNTLNGSNIKDADMEEVKRLASESGTSAEEIYAEMFSSVIKGIINEDGVMPDTLPSEDDVKNSVTSTVEDYLEYYKDIISKSEFFSEDEFKEIITNALLSGDLTAKNIDEFGKTLEKLSEVDSKDVDKKFNDLWDKYYSSSLDEQESVKNEIIDEYTEFLKQNNLNNDFLDNFLSNIYFNSEISDKDTFLKNSFSEKAEARLKEAEQNLKDEYKKISDWRLNDYADQIKNNTIQTKFGNVDMDKRTIIHWSNELKQTYADALASWNYNPEVGSIDTVFGMSDRFGEQLDGNGWEIAFTPILPDGTFLSKDTVEEYINSILKDAYADDGKVTDDELKELDAKGKNIGNTVVKGIYAGIDDSKNYENNGNWADVVGRLMHFSGEDGAIQLAKQEIHKLKEQLGKFSLSSLSFEEIFSKEDKDADDKNLNSLKKRFANYKTEISETSEYLNTLYDNNADAKTISEIVEKYGLVGDSVKDYINQLEKIQETDKSSILKEINDDILECDESLNEDTIEKLTILKQVVEDFFTDNVSKKSEIQKVKEELEELEDTQKKVKKGHIFSVDEMATLIDKYPELKKAVIECKNGYKIEAETLKDVMNASKETANQIISDEIRKKKEIIRSTQASILAYEKQLETYDTLIASMDSFYLTHADPESKHSDDAMVFADKYDAEWKIEKSKEKLKEYTDDLKELEKLYSQTISTSGKDKNNKSDSKTEKSIETIDFIEIKIKRLESAISKLKSKAEDTTKSLGSRIKNYASAISKTTSEIIVQQKAYDKYMSKANNAAKKYSLSSSIISKIQDGSIDIKDYSDTTAKHIKSYQDFYEKAIACKDAINELKLSEQALMRNKFQLHIDHYKDLYDSIGTSIDKINNKISLKESANQTIKKSDYKGLGTYYNKQYRYLEKQNSYLVKLQSTVKKGSEEWYKYNGEIQNNKNKIYETIKSYVDISKKIANLPLDKATKKIEKINNRLDVLQAKYNVAGSYKTKNKNLNKQTQEALNTKNANQEAYIETKANAKSKWNSSYIKTVRGNSKNKGKKFGEFLSTKGLDITSKAYKATVDYNNALEAEKDASNEANKSNAEYTKTLQDNTKAKYDNIAAEYASKLSVIQANTEYTKSIQELNKAQGKSDISNSAKKLAEQNKQNLQNELKVIKQERSKYSIPKIQTDYNRGKLSYEDYMSKMAYVKKLNTDINNKQVEILESQRELSEWDIKIKEQRIEGLVRVGEQLSNLESIKKAHGLGLTKKEIQEQITNNTTTITTYKAINAGLINLQNNCKKGSELWQEYQDKIDSNEKSITDLITQNEELSNSIENIPVQVIEKLGKVLDLVKNKLSGIISLTEKHGNTPSLDVLKGLIDTSIQAANTNLMLMDEAKNKINNNLRNGEWAKLTEKQIKNVWKYINSGNTKGLKDYFNNILKIDPNTLDEFFETINDISTATSNYFNEAVSAEDNLDKMFEGYINQLNDIKDHLSEINDAKQRAIELAKLEAALQAARDNKTLSVYREGIGFTYESDQTAIKEAQDNLDNFKFEELINSLDDLTKALEDMKNTYNIYNDDGTLKTDYQQIIQSIPNAIVEAIKGTKLNIVVSSDGKLTFGATPYAEGTLSALGGLSLVGEKGAELRLLNQGDGIIPHDITKNLISLGTDPTKFILDGLSKINRNVDNMQTIINLQMDNVSLPNIKSGEDADKLVNELSRIALDAAQFANKR